MMRTIGLLGGMSWESSAEYYRIINATVRERLGGLHSAECVMYSVDFAAIERLQSEGSWEKATQEMIQAAKHVQDGGADFLVICTNTMHKMAEDVERELRIPLLHIADATAHRVKARGIDKVGLLGTRFTMEEDFYRGRLVQKHDLDVVIPGVNERELVDRVIYDELCLGRIEPSSRKRYVEIIEELIDAGAEGIILGCTEIGLLVHQDDVRVPCFDTARIHAEAAVAYALTG
jgi:aspartate racemase